MSSPSSPSPDPPTPLALAAMSAVQLSPSEPAPTPLPPSPFHSHLLSDLILHLDFNIQALAHTHLLSPDQLAAFTADPAVQRTLASFRAFAALIDPLHRAARRNEALDTLAEVMRAATDPTTRRLAAVAILRATSTRPGSRVGPVSRSFIAERKPALLATRVPIPAPSPGLPPASEPRAITPASTQAPTQAPAQAPTPAHNHSPPQSQPSARIRPPAPIHPCRKAPLISAIMPPHRCPAAPLVLTADGRSRPRLTPIFIGHQGVPSRAGPRKRARSAPAPAPAATSRPSRRARCIGHRAHTPADTS